MCERMEWKAVILVYLSPCSALVSRQEVCWTAAGGRVCLTDKLTFLTTNLAETRHRAGRPIQQAGM
jgi:hypothetical protein